MDKKYTSGAHDECGVFGVYGIENAKDLVYYGLHSLQHRGQEGTGIVAVSDDGQLNKVKGLGLVTEVYNNDNLKPLTGKLAIGHVKYANASMAGIENVQPIAIKHRTGDFAIANNGQLTNAKELRRYLENQGLTFQSDSDAEILAYLVKKDRPEQKRINVIMEGLNKLDGSFSFVMVTKDRLYAARDKYGFKPLSIATLNEGYVVSSETCAFEVTGAKFLRDVAPGEVIVIDDKGIHSFNYSMFKHYNMCAMEYIYFSRPDSDIEGCNVHTFRKETGKYLFKEAPVDADIVVGVPDSSLSAASGYAEASGIPYEMGLIKNKYVGRTFIQPSQELRERGVKMKLSTVSSIVNGKKVVLIDDSIVRGTTSKQIIKLLKDAGATEVHVRIASPKFINPCYYGVDTATKEELIGARHTVEEIKDIIGADSLAFLSVEALYKAAKRTEMCCGCFTGKYPTQLYSLAPKEN